MVRVSADSLDGAYKTLRDSNRQGRPDDHVSLAQWCVQQGLYEYARDELAEALRLDSMRRDARDLLKTVEEKLNPNPVHQEAAPAADRTADGFQTPAPATMADLTAPTRAEYVRRVQPLILNKCGNVSCHGSKTETAFELLSVRPGGSRTATHDNLGRIVERIDSATPAASRLLAALATETHQRVFVGKTGDVQLSVLREWVEDAAADLTGVTAEDAPKVVFAEGFAERIRGEEGAKLQPVERPPVLQPTPKEALLDDVLRDERPDPFDPDAFNRLR
jgi:hypothetical protein